MNKDAVVSLVQSNFPSSLLTQPIWLAYYFRENKDGTFSKPPCKGYTVKAEDPGFTFEHVIQHGYPGIKLTKTDIIAFDIDDKDAKLRKREFSFENLSPSFREFIADQDTYMEWSPSRCGLRILFRVNDKTSLPGRANLRPDMCIGGEFYANSGYVTITGDHISGESIKTISASDVMPWIGAVPEEKEEPRMPSFEKVPTLEDVQNALDVCKLDQSSQVHKAYETITGQPYNHYDYWIRILSACHHFAMVSGLETKILAEVIDWSQTDPTSYEDEADVITHWESMGSKEKPVTYHTLFKFAKLMKFSWPKEKYDKKGLPTGKPLIHEADNFEYLMDYYDIKIYQEPYSKLYYITGDDTVLNNRFRRYNTKRFFGKLGPYIEENLVTTLWKFSQDNHYDNITKTVITPHAKDALAQAQPFSLMQNWLETPYDELPDDLKEKGTDPTCSNLDYLMSCIEFRNTQNMELAYKYFEAFFFGMVMPIYNTKWRYPEHNFMLIMTGPENCRKTTFFINLLPQNMADHLIIRSVETLNGEKSIRDFKRQLSSAAIVIVDEFELFYNRKNDSIFKSLVTSSGIDFTEIYATSTNKSRRTAALAGTTNKESIPMEKDSSRRIAMVSVNSIDTNAMEKINWHTFYRSFVQRGKKLMAQNKYPWKLDQKTIDLQYQENEQYRSTTDLEIALMEVYNWDAPFLALNNVTSVQTEKELLKGINDIKGDIMQKFPSMKFKNSALVQELKRLCGKYSNTSKQQLSFPNCAGTLYQGVAKHTQWTKYTVPPKKTEFTSE